MLILPEFSRPYLIESSNSPIVPKLFWGFSASMLDFTLLPLTYLEETSGASITISINGFEFDVPYTWNIIVSDPYTLDLDCMPIIECTTTISYALIMTPGDSKFRTEQINIERVNTDSSLVHPLIQKGIALCHPVGEVELNDKSKTVANIVIGPHDISKWIINKSYGDII